MRKKNRIVDEILLKVKERLERGGILPKSKFREALNYTHGLAGHLKNYLWHPCARMENNVAERAVRPLALGRKNWLFMGSEAGGKSSTASLG